MQPSITTFYRTHIGAVVATMIVRSFSLLIRHRCHRELLQLGAQTISDDDRILSVEDLVDQIAVVLNFFWVGRIAGQLVKPRSDPFVEKDGVKLLSYKRDNVKGDAFDGKAKINLYNSC
ncbi:hypothetical protein FNV43_RR05524 [Rhamnella rubrinervis]|uniref:Phospho-2-dehydro-3-deoxyheptonate aldolase n=1 Tax=Rhamnella rubrinervis TaxID=2594499 RepID=A0A8K0MQI7_9ROSA|nr:hypothetical protein FNV43_RR05524 [Rhamnella rubrinervis]